MHTGSSSTGHAERGNGREFRTQGTGGREKAATSSSRWCQSGSQGDAGHREQRSDLGQLVSSKYLGLRVTLRKKTGASSKAA